jgi:hypothetical protein
MDFYSDPIWIVGKDFSKSPSHKASISEMVENIHVWIVKIVGLDHISQSDLDYERRLNYILF